MRDRQSPQKIIQPALAGLEVSADAVIRGKFRDGLRELRVIEGVIAYEQQTPKA